MRKSIITCICIGAAAWPNACPALATLDNDWMDMLGTISNGVRQSRYCPKCDGIDTTTFCCPTEKTSYRCKCNAGYKSSGNTSTCTCNACGAGYYSAADNTLTSCTPCAQGTYNDAAAAASCTACPTSGGVAGTTDSTGAASITECYLPAGTTGTDAGGSFTYPDKCHYVK